MATKKAKKAEVTESVTLSASQLKRIGNVMCDAYGKKDAAGGAIAKSLCAALKPIMPEKGVLSQESVDEVVKQIRKDRNWSADTTKSRKTEIKAILTSSRHLSAAVDAYTVASKGVVGWNAVVGLARKLAVPGTTIADAVKAQRSGKTSAKIDDRDGAVKWVAMQLGRILNAECIALMPRGFEKALNTFAAENGLVKL